MDWFQIVTFVAIQVWISTATKILYVIPDDSTNTTSCLSYSCATLSQYLLDNNNTLPALSNVQYYFLPGKHQISTKVALRNLHNFSIIGIAKVSSSQPAVLVGCSQSYVIKISDSYNVTIANVMFRQCDQLKVNKRNDLTNLFIELCHSCIIEKVVFINLALKGTNLTGNTYLTEIAIKSDGSEKNLMVFCQGIRLIYWNWQPYPKNNHFLMMNQINISSNKCYNSYSVGIHISMLVEGKLMIIIKNSLFYKLDHTALNINSRYHGSNMVISENCTFAQNGGITRIDQYLFSIRPLINIILFHANNSVVFKQCSFTKNFNNHYLIMINVDHIYYCFGPLTSISFIRCKFTKNIGELINLEASICRVDLFITGPSYFTTNMVHNHLNSDNLITISYANVYIIGSVIMSSNHAISILDFESCDVLVYKHILLKSNNCDQVISLQFTCIKMMEYANITLFKNKYFYKLIEMKYNNEYKLYPLCIFQFMTLKNTTATSPSHYSINLIDNTYIVDFNWVLNVQHDKKCAFPYYHLTPHCQWIPTAAFHNFNPRVVYQEVIKLRGANLTYHKICHCSQNKNDDCSVDTLGPVYPGQTLQLQLCTPCSEEISILYAEVNSIHQPNSTCKVASEIKTNFISKHAKLANFTIISEAANTCELFLAASSYSQYINEAFYVKVMSCPVGFTLQNGICNCDPIFSTYTDKCYIDHSAIEHSANTWITAHTIANNTEYLISDCPMDYCLPYSSKLNLLYPELQCQFNRTGILCSQCQHPLSMVFGSSRCLKCNNVYIILISVIVMVAGIGLVIILYLLNLTVTNGTINGIIFYANVVSINDSVFLVNENVFKPLRLFISFTNLDLGIETCFYNGMSSYAKMWLQMFFPSYLIVIAVSIIISSRYSSRILRLTYTRSLPVLATLFLLSYTGVLRIILTVLFSYSTITHLPSGQQQIAWSIDASVPLFRGKFTILFITCLILFLLLIPFNIILSTRYLLQFNVINRFKPLLDAFQGSYKDKYYYWVGVHITIRSLLFAMYAFSARLKLILSTMVLMVFSIYTGYVRPHKNKLINIQELMLQFNLSMMYAVSYQGNGRIFSTVINIAISLALIQLFIITLYHFLCYTCHCNVAGAMQHSKQKLMKLCNLCCNNHSEHSSRFDIELLNIPERTYDYAEYQDGLASSDFKAGIK